MPPRLGDAKADYLKWRAEVLDQYYLPEYKLKKLWTMNFGVGDIVAGRHHSVFPPPRDGEGRPRLTLDLSKVSSGRKLRASSVDFAYAKALELTCVRLLRTYRMDLEQRQRLIADHKRFREMRLRIGRNRGRKV